MATITRVGKAGGGTNFNAGQIIDPAEVNDDFNTVYSVINGGLDDANIASGSITADSITPGSITAASLAPDSVGEAQIQAGAIPGSKNLRFTQKAIGPAPPAGSLELHALDYKGAPNLFLYDGTGNSYVLGTHTRIGSAAGAVQRAGAVGLTNSHYVGASIPATTAATDLMQYNFPANGCSWDGQCLRIRVQWITSPSAGTKTIYLIFAGQIVMSDATAVPAALGVSDTLIQRTNVNGFRFTTKLSIGQGDQPATTRLRFADVNSGPVWTSDIAVRVVGQTSLAAAGEITAYCLNVEVLNHYA